MWPERLTLSLTLVAVLCSHGASADEPTVDQTLGFERVEAWRTAADLPAQFAVDQLWSSRTIPYAELAGGLTLDAGHVKAGGSSGRWANHPRYPSLHTHRVPRDWSGVRALSGWVYSESATGELVTLAVCSDNPDTAWIDAFTLDFRIDWTGWRQLVWSLADGHALGQPAGWSEITGLAFWTKAFSHQPVPETVLYLDDFQLQSTATTTTVTVPSAARGELLPVTLNVPRADLSRLNHTGPEVSAGANAVAPITYQAYFKTERALFGYDPKFVPAPVSFDPSGRAYLCYGGTRLQWLDDDGRWQTRDLLPDVLEPYAKQRLGFDELSVNGTGQGNDASIRFDADGDAYLLCYVADPTRDWKARTGLLLHSRDQFRTWTVYRLPYYFARFEKLDQFNPDCLRHPPVVLLSRYFGPTELSLLVPTKQSDGTLELGDPVPVAKGTMAAIPHSGEANQMISHGDQIFIVYGALQVLPGKTKEDGAPAYAVAYDRRTGKLSDPVLVGFGGRNAEDEHNWPAIAADSHGLLHVIVNGHHNPFVYTRSLKPWSLAAWVPPEQVASGTTYAGLVCDRDDTLYSVTRCSDPGYYFRLSLHRKRAGQPWEPPRHLVIPFKPYYKVWFHKLVQDTKRQRLFLYYWSQSPSLCLFKDELLSYLDTWPDLGQRCLETKDGPRWPLGTALMQPRKYEFYAVPPSEPAILMSDDHGETWRLAETDDFR